LVLLWRGRGRRHRVSQHIRRVTAIAAGGCCMCFTSTRHCCRCWCWLLCKHVERVSCCPSCCCCCWWWGGCKGVYSRPHLARPATIAPQLIQ
jgi:hypothetical protein